MLSYDLDEIVAHYAGSYGLTLETARTHERELKRYLALRALDRDGAYGMAGVADKLWHAFILFTKDYARFCSEAVGFFIHHVPRTKARTARRTRTTRGRWRPTSVCSASRRPVKSGPLPRQRH